MDTRNLIFPMTAGDLVESAAVVTRDNDDQIVIRRVLNVVQSEAAGGEEFISVYFDAPSAQGNNRVEMKKTTPLLITDISYW